MDWMTPTIALSPVPLWIPFLCGVLLAGMLGLLVLVLSFTLLLRAALRLLAEYLSELEEENR